MTDIGSLAALRADADPAALLDAFLIVHARGDTPSALLLPRGEDLHRALAADPPALPAWGRFLVALGQLCAEAGATAEASRHFHAALTGIDRHGDHEAGVAAGYDQGVLLERRGALLLAAAAYRAAASEGFRLGVRAPVCIAAATAAIRLHFAAHDHLDAAHAGLAKHAWLTWTWLAVHQPDAVADHAAGDPGRQLCAFLLPEDPGELAARFRAWPPEALTAGDPWRDADPRCLASLFALAAASAAAHLHEEPGEPAAAYRALHAAARRQLTR